MACFLFLNFVLGLLNPISLENRSFWRFLSYFCTYRTFRLLIGFHFRFFYLKIGFWVGYRAPQPKNLAGKKWCNHCRTLRSICPYVPQYRLPHTGVTFNDGFTVHRDVYVAALLRIFPATYSERRVSHKRLALTNQCVWVENTMRSTLRVVGFDQTRSAIERCSTFRLSCSLDDGAP